jgi:hypothetical protein
MVGFSFPVDNQTAFANSFNEPLPSARTNAQATTDPANAAGQKADKATDIKELGDLVNMAGINLKDEEAAFFASSYRQHPSTNEYFPHLSKRQPGQAFEMWSRSPTISHLAEIGLKSGVLSNTVTPAQWEHDLERFVAAVSEASEKSKHMSSPFLLGQVVRQIMSKRQAEENVRLRTEVGEITVNGNTNVTGTYGRLPDGSAVVATRTVAIPQKSELANLMSLISLAAQERIRSLLEDAYSSSRARVYGDHGTVPPEWSDIATGNGEAEETLTVQKSITGTAWDAIPESATSPSIPMKRKLDGEDAAQALPSPPLRESSEPKPTVRYPPAIPRLLVQLGDEDLEAERKRIAARKKRKEAKEAQEKEGGGPVAAPDASTPATAAATPVASTMPPPPTTPSEAGTPTGIKRKKGDKGGKQSHISDLAQHAAATSTAKYFAGGAALAKKYSWLSGGGGAAPSTPSRGLSTGAGMSDRLAAQNAKKETSSTSVSDPKEDPALDSKQVYKRLGLLKEAPGVQMMDVLGVLERSGKEKKALLRGYQRLDRLEREKEK